MRSPTETNVLFHVFYLSLKSQIVFRSVEMFCWFVIMGRDSQCVPVFTFSLAFREELLSSPRGSQGTSSSSSFKMGSAY